MSIRSLIIPVVVLSLFTFSAQAEGKGGDEFRRTAQGYEQKASKYRNKNSEIASLYQRMAQIKRDAAQLGKVLINPARSLRDL